MLILICFGVVSLAAGVLFLFFPEKLAKLNISFNKASNKVTASIDELMLRLHAGVGISCILLSLTCFFLVYCIIKKHG